EGQRLTLVEEGGLGDGEAWADSPVQAEHDIRGLGPITMTVTQLAPTDLVLTKALAMEAVRTYADPESPRHTVHVFTMAGAGPAAELHIAVRPDMAVARPGAGGVHHVAFRVPIEAQYKAWEV